MQINFNFRRAFPSYGGVYADVWNGNGGSAMAFPQRPVVTPTLYEYKVTKDKDILNLQADGLSVFRVSSGGDIFTQVGGTINTSGADLAERYTSQEELVPGQVVSIDPQNNHGVRSSQYQYQPDLVGIVSTDPGFISGAYTEDSYPIALIGRVPVLVTTENGMVNSGDYVTSSAVPGYAMRATLAGRVLGKALESMDPTKLVDCPASMFAMPNRKCTTIMVFVNLIDYGGDSVDLVMSNWNAMHQVDGFTNNGLTFGTTTINNGLVSSIDGQAITTRRNISAHDDQVLKFLETMKADRAQNGSFMSEIFADKVSAVSQMISPNVVTNLLNAERIEGLTIGAEEIKTGKLQVDSIIGGFVLRRANSASAILGIDTATTSIASANATSTDGRFAIVLPDDVVVSFDDAGSVVFAGDVLAQSVRTNALTVAGTATFTSGLTVNSIGATSTMISMPGILRNV